MKKTEEKRNLLIFEENLRKKIAWQWKQLRDTVTQPIMYAFMIHPKNWGHHTKSWKRAQQSREQNDDHPDISAPPLPNNQVLPDKVVPPPPVLPPRNRGDVYGNRSTVLTYKPDEDEFVVDLKQLELGDTDSDDITEEEVFGHTTFPQDADENAVVEISAGDDDFAELGEDSHASPVLIACPPPFLSVYDAGYVE